MHTSSEKGNALFLILIAVILFAALSYAITQSNRSGGDAARETTLVTSTTLIQYAQSVQTAVMRMTLRGVTPDELDFVAPNDPTFNNAPVTTKVFHPNGGGAAWQNIDPNTVELDANNVPVGMGVWTFEALYGGGAVAVKNIGTTADDIVMALDHIRKGVCEAINEKLTGSKTIPIGNYSSGLYAPIEGTGIDGHASLCIDGAVDGYVFYHVLLER